MVEKLAMANLSSAWAGRRKKNTRTRANRSRLNLIGEIDLFATCLQQ
jgi:hypothetical protein